jgi:hypothetical protein
MSYDIELKCPTCGVGPELPNPTYNLTPIFHLALTNEPLPNPDVSEGAVVVFGAKTDGPRGLRVLSGRRAADTLDQLRNAINQLCDPNREVEFRALEPPNKWGTLETAITVVEQLVQTADQYPNHMWEIR